MSAARALAWYRSRQARAVAALQEFLRFPSVSAQPAHASDVRRCAGWLAAQLARLGMEHARVVPTAGHPLVLAEWCRAPNRPTLLVYGHYDVQPAEPLREWKHPPFEPVVRGEQLFARGASDDKGQVFIHLLALAAWLRTSGRLPVNVLCVFEGEEEIGSASLTRALTHAPPRRHIDAVVVSDTPMRGPGRPALTYALRGNLACELHLSGPSHDLHSGQYGGAVHNPLQVLCEVLAGLHDPDGRVAIPGFHRRIRPWGAEERELLRRSGPSDSELLRSMGSASSWGEPGYTSYERTTLLPALTLNGMSGGYQGPGAKGVIPARASAKLSFRLVPDQEPREIERLLRRRLALLTPPTTCWELRVLSAARPVLLPRRHPVVHCAATACRRVFGVDPVFLRSGGTIPVVSLLQERIGAPIVLMGFALPEDRKHAPDERLHLPTFHAGVATVIAFLEELGGTRQRLARAGTAFASSEEHVQQREST